MSFHTPRFPVSDVTRILDAISQGEPSAADQLLPMVYDELRKLAAHRMSHEAPGQTLQPTALVHEAWLRLTNGANLKFEGRGHFFAAAAEAMRRILIDKARRKARVKHGAGQVRLDLEEHDLAATEIDERVLLLNEALAQLETEDPEMGRIVVLKYFGGLTNQEVAETLGLTERTIERRWAFAKAWLYRAIRASPA